MFAVEIPVIVLEVKIFLAVSDVKVTVVCFSVIFLAVSLPLVAVFDVVVVLVDFVVVELCRCAVVSFVDISIIHNLMSSQFDCIREVPFCCVII